MKNKFYITTAIPYVNGKPHIGHALEYVQADIVVRYHRLIGDESLLLSGSDENGLKIVQAAEAQGLSPQALSDQNTKLFQEFAKKLNVNVDIWRRGSDQKYHWPGVSELWKKSLEAGDIYNKIYRGLYCVGCEDFYLQKDLVDGKCPEHLKVPEIVEEENYFFRLSKYEKKLKDLITSGELKVIPDERRNEILALIESGLQDFSISRSKKRAKGWGIPVPGDENQVIYTWYDGLAIYITGVGYGYDKGEFDKWWPANVHFIGKGINRFHTLYWPAMLISAGLSIPRSVFIHGYITSGGQKISKTLGNVIDPIEVIDRYGADATRYYLLREIPATKDGDFTYERFEQLYNSDLANGLGNLVQRVAKLCEIHNISILSFVSDPSNPSISLIFSHLDRFEFNLAIEELWREFSALDIKITTDEPWKKTKEKVVGYLRYYVKKLLELSQPLSLLLPQTAAKIQQIFKGPKIVAPPTPLFPRLP